MVWCSLSSVNNLSDLLRVAYIMMGDCNTDKLKAEKHVLCMATLLNAMYTEYTVV